MFDDGSPIRDGHRPGQGSTQEPPRRERSEHQRDRGEVQEGLAREGFARAYLGEIQGANLIKLHRHSCKVSYLVYPDFATDPHPALLRSIKLSLRTRELDCFDYARSTNPPVLHRKETFLTPGHPLADRFARLTRQEEKHGLLDDTAAIDTRDGWEGGWPSAGSGFAGTGWCGGGTIRRKRGNHEIDERHEKKRRSKQGTVSAMGTITNMTWTDLELPARRE